MLLPTHAPVFHNQTYRVDKGFVIPTPTVSNGDQHVVLDDIGRESHADVVIISWQAKAV